MAALLYFLTTILVLLLIHRSILPISRRAALVLTLLPLVITGKALLTSAVYAPIDPLYLEHPFRAMKSEVGLGGIHNGFLSDLYAQIIPWKSAVRDAYLGGEWPLWNPYQFAGDILAASSQPAPYDPILLLTLLLPFPETPTFLASMTLFLYGLWMFVWLRELGSSEQVSLFGATAWMFGNFVLFWLMWPMAATIVWLPLVLTGVHRVLERRLRGVVVLTAAFTIMLLSGHPESALHIVAIAGVFTLWNLWVSRSWKLAELSRLIAAGVLALLLSAIYLLPILDAIPQSVEHRYREQVYAKIRRSIPISHAAARLTTNVVPFAYGIEHEGTLRPRPVHLPMATAYGGTLLFPLAVFALWRSRRRERWLLLGLALAGFAIGVDAPVAADLLALLPLFDIALNDRLIVLALFSLAALSAFGIEAWQERREGRRLALLYGAHAVVYVAGLAALWPAMRSGGLHEDYLITKSLFLVVPLIGAALLTLKVRVLTTAFAILLALLIVQRVFEAKSFYPAIPRAAFYPEIPEFESLPDETSPYRIVGTGDVFTPASATLYGLEDVRGYQAMTFRPWRNTYPLWCENQPVWFNEVNDLTRPFLSFLNVRYAIAEPGTAAPTAWRVIRQSERMTLLENENFTERAFVPEHIRLNLADRDMMWEMTLETDFSNRSWIDDGGEPVRADLANGPGRVEVRAASMKRREISVTMEHPGYLVISELGWNGWRAYRNREEIPVHTANHAFLAVHLPEGEHQVTLVYWPHAFVTGANVSLVTILSLLAFWGIRLFRRTRGVVIPSAAARQRQEPDAPRSAG